MTTAGIVSRPENPTIDDVLLENVNKIINHVDRRIRQSRLPDATYRVQFNGRCRFRDIEAFVPYLCTLGISDLYASPFLQACPGSMHGYDIVNHSAINSEIGTLEELRELRSVLRKHDMGLIADVVPNHMSANPQFNGWWQDVLENGPSSQYASYFDIDWMPLKPDLADKVLLPVLGDQFGRVLESGQLSVRYEEGAFWLKYFDNRFPLAPRSYSLILSTHLEELQRKLGRDDSDYPELLSVLTALKNLPTRSETNADRLVERRREKEVIKRRLHEIVCRSVEVAKYIEATVSHLNGIQGDPGSFDLLDQLLNEQAYRLAYWRVAADEINYRRFFDINDLAAICTEEPRVFADSHRLLLGLLGEGTVTGLRIDHPDGLYDPCGYLTQLQEHRFMQLCQEVHSEVSPRNSSSEPDAGDSGLAEWTVIWPHLAKLWRASVQFVGSPLARPLFIIVEKILSHGETPPKDWPIDGTVGYDFLNTSNGLFIDPQGERPMSALYSRFTRQPLEFGELAYQDKRLIVRMSMSSELNVLGHRLDRISERNRWTRDFTLSSLTDALREVISCFTVYRSYVRPGRLLERDRHNIEEAISDAKLRNPAMDRSIFDFLRDVLLLRTGSHDSQEERLPLEKFVGKFQQLTGPIMAKAVEDTTCYRFNRLTSLNEVGGEPARFGISPEQFHRINDSRAAQQPHSINATSTHDTKRSEDVRARINVLSEIPQEWRERVQRWSRWNRGLKTIVNGIEAPSRNAEYLLYQTLIGTWPGAFSNDQMRSKYIARMQTYLLKVVREAKVHTSWISPNQEYESAIPRFIAGLFDPKRRSFLKELNEFALQIADHGCWNSLSQLLLKMSSPGVPDFYQGCELWNLTLVDPDNRQPIDLTKMKETLDGLLKGMAHALDISNSQCPVEAWLNPEFEGNRGRIANLLQGLVLQKSDGRIKLFTTLVGLRLRKKISGLFSRGTYLPLTMVGRFADNVLAFARSDHTRSIVVVVPRLTVGVVGFGGALPLGSIWQDTAIALPPNLSRGRLYEVFSRQFIPLTKSSDSPDILVPVADALQHLGVAIFEFPAS